MNEGLNEILNFYENEKLALQDIIKSYIEDFEYKVAYFHSKGLKKVNQKIQLLKNLENSNSDQIDSLRRSKNIYDNIHPGLKDNEEYLNYINEQKNKIDDKIENFIKQSKQEKIDGQEFDDVLFSLVENRIEHFKFQLSKESNIYLDFKKVENNLFISIPNYKNLRNNYIQYKSSIRALKAIGFKKHKIEKSLLLIYPLFNFKDTIEIKELTSRIIYDGIGYFNINNQSTIEIVN